MEAHGRHLGIDCGTSVTGLLWCLLLCESDLMFSLSDPQFPHSFLILRKKDKSCLPHWSGSISEEKDIIRIILIPINNINNNID